MRPALSGRRRGGLLMLNAAGAAAAAAFAAVGLARPSYIQPGAPATALTGFWAASSAVRTWAVAVPLLTGILRGGHPAPQLLVAASVVELGDAALGAWQHNPRMTVFPAAMGLTHLVSARLLAR